MACSPHPYGPYSLGGWCDSAGPVLEHRPSFVSGHHGPVRGCWARPIMPTGNLGRLAILIPPLEHSVRRLLTTRDGPPEKLPPPYPRSLH